MTSRLRLGAQPYRLPLRSPLATGARTFHERRGWWVTLRDGQGTEGLGEVAPLESFGTESLAEAQAELDDLSRRGLPGPWPHDLVGIRHLLLAWQPETEFRAVRAGLELALLDGLARRRGVSLSRLLVPEPLERLPVHRLLTAQDPLLLAEQGAQALEQGFSAVKIKVGVGPLAHDLARIEALRRRVGPRLRLRLDANGAWNFDTARRALKRLARWEIELIEQPIPGADPFEFAALRELGIPVAVDEALGDFRWAERIIEERRVDAVVLKPTLLGGIGVCMRLAELARRVGVEVVVTSALERRVGLAGAIHLAAAISQPEAAHGLATLDAFDPTEEGLSLEGGELLVPQGPGVGVGVPPAVEPVVVRPLLPPILEAAERWPCKLALRHGDRLWSWRELASYAEGAARGLYAAGLGPTDRVGLWASNRPEWVAIAHACSLIGAVLVPLNVRLTEQEVAAQCAQVGVSLVLSDRATSGPGRLGRTPVLPLDHAWQTQGERPGLAYDPGAVAALMFTSGTTGRPKAAMLTGANLRASAEASNTVLGLTEGDRWGCAMPLFHVGGLGILVRTALAGAGTVLHAAFDAPATLEAIPREGLTVLSVVPTMLRRLVEALGDRPWPAPLRAMLVGGAPLPDDLIARCPQALPTYGLTEAASHVTLWPPGAPWRPGQGAGPALPGTELRILDEQGHSLPSGAIGQIAARGPQVFAGYWSDPEATACALREGWLLTGDEGMLDEAGRLHVLARRSDLIVSGGENVYPAEVEAALERHPDVREAAVVGRPDATWGQVPVALLVPRAGSIDLDGVRAYLGRILAKYKHPRAYQILDDLPRLASGKVDRRALAEQGRQP